MIDSHRAVEKALAANQNILQPNMFELRAPIYDPQKLICVGLNYRDHCEEQNVQVPTEPLIFSKFSSAITEPNGHVELSDLVTVRCMHGVCVCVCVYVFVCMCMCN